MTRRSPNFPTALSLLLFAAVAFLWLRSYLVAPGAEDHASAYVPWRHARYTIRSEKGRLTLYAPPAASGAWSRPVATTAERLVPILRNDQVVWEAGVWTDGRAGPYFSPRLQGEPGKTLLAGHAEAVPGRGFPVVSKDRRGGAAAAGAGAAGPVRGGTRRPREHLPGFSVRVSRLVRAGRRPNTSRLGAAAGRDIRR